MALTVKNLFQISAHIIVNAHNRNYTVSDVVSSEEDGRILYKALLRDPDSSESVVIYWTDQDDLDSDNRKIHLVKNLLENAIDVLDSALRQNKMKWRR